MTDTARPVRWRDYPLGFRLRFWAISTWHVGRAKLPRLGALRGWLATRTLDWRARLAVYAMWWQDDRPPFDVDCMGDWFDERLRVRRQAALADSLGLELGPAETAPYLARAIAANRVLDAASAVMAAQAPPLFLPPSVGH